MTLMPVEKFEKNPAVVGDGARVEIRSQSDLASARELGRTLAAHLGFPSCDLPVIAAVISELARNILDYAKHGEIIVMSAGNNGTRGIRIVAHDEGPGIPDVAQALRLGYSTSGGLGLGLPGVRQVTDDFAITSAPGRGTTVSVMKWKRRVTH